jgi:hypothetical protein
VAEHDPLAAEFAALRSALLVRPPGVRAVQLRLRQKRHRTVVVLTSVVAFVVAAAGVAFAGIRAPHPEVPATQRPPSRTASASPTRGQVPAPGVSATIGGRPPVGGSPTAKSSAGTPCTQYGAVLLDHPTATQVTVKVDQQGLYPLCPTEKVRVLVAVYWYDAQQVQHLYYSKSGTLDTAHNPLTLPYQTPTTCDYIVYVVSGNQPVNQTLGPMQNPYADGPAVWGGKQWGPYNGIVWINDQSGDGNPCPSAPPAPR